MNDKDYTATREFLNSIVNNKIHKDRQEQIDVILNTCHKIKKEHKDSATEFYLNIFKDKPFPDVNNVTDEELSEYIQYMLQNRFMAYNKTYEQIVEFIQEELKIREWEYATIFAIVEEHQMIMTIHLT